MKLQLCSREAIKEAWHQQGLSVPVEPIVLPPKRFQTTEPTRYDTIRHRPWFDALNERRAKIDQLRAAYDDFYQRKELITQSDLAKIHGIDERELRDYMSWINSPPESVLITSISRYILDQAYLAYCFEKAARPFTVYISRACKLAHIQRYRGFIEMWDVDHAYPSRYAPELFD